MLIAALFTIAKECREHMSIDRWMDKEACGTYKHIELCIIQP